MPRRKRLIFGALLVLAAVVAVLFAGVAGAATASAPEAEASLPNGATLPEDPAEAPPAPRRYVAMGAVVAIRPDRLAVKVAAQDRPIAVLVRPMTAVRINMRRADLAQIQPGDRVVVVGRPNPRGNLVARAIAVVRRPPVSS